MLNMGTVRAAGRVYSVRAIDLVKESFNIDLKHALSLYPPTVESYLSNPNTFTEEIWQEFRDSGLNVIQTTVLELV